MKPILAVLAAALAATGCATGPDMSTDDAPRVEREYVTGSNIGRRKGEAPTDQIRTYSREALENTYRTGGFGGGVTPNNGGGSAAGN